MVSEAVQGNLCILSPESGTHKRNILLLCKYWNILIYVFFLPSKLNHGREGLLSFFRKFHNLKSLPRQNSSLASKRENVIKNLFLANKKVIRQQVSCSSHHVPNSLVTITQLSNRNSCCFQQNSYNTYEQKNLRPFFVLHIRNSQQFAQVFWLKQKRHFLKKKPETGIFQFLKISF